MILKCVHWVLSHLSIQIEYISVTIPSERTLRVKKILVSKQYEYCLFTVLHLCYKQGLRISKASCGLGKTG